MKNRLNKITVILAGLLLSANSAFAGSGESSMELNDTMIFSLFIVAAIIFLMIIYAQINILKGILEIADFGSLSKKSGSNDSAKKAGMIALLMMLGSSVMAQDAEVGGPLIVMTDELYWIMISLNAFLLGIIITLYFVAKGLIRKVLGEEEEEVDAIASLTYSLTDAVPIEQEGEIMLDHNYDGIKELDNNLPPWWKYGFYFTIVFAVVYLIRFHVIGTGPSQLEEYQQQVEEAEAQIAAYMETQANNVDESNLVALTDGDRLTAGKQIFINNCQVCHGANGEGVVGPNLTDEYWIHGGGISNVYNLIKVGVAEKGMISWESQLTPGQMLEVSSYILSLQGTNPPNAKAPEGEVWKESTAPAEPVETESEETMEEGDMSSTEEEVKA